MNWLIDLGTLPVSGAIVLKVTLILIVTIFLHLIIKGRSARWRVLMWRCAFVLIAAVSVTAFSGMRWEVPVLRSSSDIESAPPIEVQDKVYDEVNSFSGEVVVTGYGDPYSPLPATNSKLPATTPIVVYTAPRPAIEVFAIWLNDNFKGVLLIGWFLGVLFLFLRSFAGAAQIRALRKHTSSPPRKVEQTYNVITSQLGLQKPPALAVSHGLTIPYISGVIDPMIILPSEMMDEQYHDDLPAVLAHELAHWRGGDLLWKHFIVILSMLLWWNPLMWIAHRLHDDACEEIADGAAAEISKDKENYSALIARLALQAHGAAAPGGAIPMIRKSRVMRRLKSLERNLSGRPLGGGVMSLAAMVALIIGVTFGGSVIVEAQTPPKDVKNNQMATQNKSDQNSEKNEFITQSEDTKIKELESRIAELEKQIQEMKSTQDNKQKSTTQSNSKYTDEEIQSNSVAYFFSRIGDADSGKHGFAPMWALIEKYKTGDDATRDEVIEGASQIIQNDENMFRRWQCCYVISGSGEVRGIPVLGEALMGDSNETVRGVAACALGAFNDEASLKLLNQALEKEESTEVKGWIERAIKGEFKKNFEEPLPQDESQLGKMRDELAMKGDLKRAQEIEMERVMARKRNGNVWKDKIDLISTYDTWKTAKNPSDEEIREAMTEIAGGLVSMPDPSEYEWRYMQLFAVMADDLGNKQSAIQSMNKALSAYPDVEYADPAKHSKYQHLINQQAMYIWDAEGVEAAEDWLVDRYQNDRKFAHFHDNPWEQRYRAEGDPWRLNDLKKRLGAVKNRVSEMSLSNEVRVTMEKMDKLVALGSKAMQTGDLKLTQKTFDEINELCDELQGKNNNPKPQLSDWDGISQQEYDGVYKILAEMENDAEGMRELCKTIERTNDELYKTMQVELNNKFQAEYKLLKAVVEADPNQ